MKAAHLPMAVVELLLAGLRSSWMPVDYSVVAVEVSPGVITLGVGMGDGSHVVAVERLHCSITFEDDLPPRHAGPCPDAVADAWLRLVAAAWKHRRLTVPTRAAPVVEGAH